MNKKSIQILRGTREKILKNKDEKLLKGLPLYNLTDNTLSIGDENSNIDKLPIATNELHGNIDGVKSTNALGVYDYSISYVDNKGISIKNDVKYDGESIIFSDGLIGTQKGDIIPGAEATGIQSMAFGGKRWDYLNLEGTIYERDVTKAIGNLSFAAGGSVQAHGDFSVALNKDTRAYQSSSMAIGGGTQAGMTEEDFFELYTLTPDKFPIPTTELDSSNHYQKYMIINQSISGYTGEYCALYKYENGKLYYTHVNYANNSVFPGIYTPEECLRSNYTEVRDAQGSSYDRSYSFAFAGGALSKAYERHAFAFGSSTIAKGRNAAAFNSNTIASGLSSFATGIGPDETYIATNGEVGARGRVSFVEGKVTDATGEAAHAGGGFTNASGDYSFAFGYRTQATEYCAMSIGASTIASGKQSFAGGAVSTASGENAFVFGNNVVVNGTSSAAFGSSNNIYLNSNYSFVAGINNNIQYGSQNIILGNTNIIGNPSSTKGCSNNFVANSSNIVDNTSANANNTAVFGLENTAKHSGAFINGHGNKSSNIYQTVIGTYNKDNSDALLIVGNGTTDSSRKNTFEVLKDGIKTSRLKAINDADLTIYFDNNLNGSRKSSIWANDINILSDPTNTSSSYVSVSNKINQIDNKLDKSTSATSTDQAYIKYASGEQGRLNIGYVGNGLAKYTSDKRLEVATPKSYNSKLSCVNREYVDTEFDEKSDIYWIPKEILLSDCLEDRSYQFTRLNFSDIDGVVNPKYATSVSFSSGNNAYEIGPKDENGFDILTITHFPSEETTQITENYIGEDGNTYSRLLIENFDINLGRVGFSVHYWKENEDEIDSFDYYNYIKAKYNSAITCKANYNLLQNKADTIYVDDKFNEIKNNGPVKSDDIALLTDWDPGRTTGMIGIVPTKTSSTYNAFEWNNLAPSDTATPWWYTNTILQGEERYGVCTSFSTENHGWSGRAFDVKFGVNIQGNIYYFTYFIDNRMLNSTSLQIPFNILLINNIIVNGAICFGYTNDNYSTVGITESVIQIDGSTIELTPSTDSEQQNTIWISHRIAWNEFGA